jgi:dihydropteroate synthase
MQNKPQTMQLEPNYQHVVEDVGQFLAQKIDQLSRCGIEPERIAIDPGFGFGKTAQHNLTLLHRLAELQLDSSTLLVGLSRKKTLTKIVGDDAQSLTTASVVAAILAIERGAKVIRVHDVKPSVQAVKVWSAMYFEDLP